MYVGMYAWVLCVCGRVREPRMGGGSCLRCALCVYCTFSTYFNERRIQRLVAVRIAMPHHAHKHTNAHRHCWGWVLAPHVRCFGAVTPQCTVVCQQQRNWLLRRVALSAAPPVPVCIFYGFGYCSRSPQGLPSRLCAPCIVANGSLHGAEPGCSCRVGSCCLGGLP